MVTRGEAEELLRTLFADPEGARATALAELVPDPDAFVASVGHQVVGIVLRDLGEAGEGLAQLRRSLALARRGDREREATSEPRSALCCSTSGAPATACAQLDRAAEQGTGWRWPGCWCVAPGCWFYSTGTRRRR